MLNGKTKMILRIVLILCLISVLFACFYEPFYPPQIQPEIEHLNSVVEKEKEKDEIEVPEFLPKDEVTKRTEIMNMIISIQYEFGIKNSNDYVDAIFDASEKYGVPHIYLIAAVAEESSFREDAESFAGAIGPMQVIPRFWADKTEYDPNVFYDNIQLGAYILQHYKSKCGNTWECAFKAYNVGITNYNNNKLVDAQKRYWKKISTRYENLK